MATLNLLWRLHLPPFSFCSFFISVAVVLVMKRHNNFTLEYCSSVFTTNSCLTWYLFEVTNRLDILLLYSTPLAPYLPLFSYSKSHLTNVTCSNRSKTVMIDKEIHGVVTVCPTCLDI